MPIWFLLIIASAILYAGVILLDKYVLGKYFISPVLYLAVGNIVGVVVALIAWLNFVENFQLRYFYFIEAIVVGVLFNWFTYLYFRTLSFASPVVTASYMQVVPVVTAVLSFYYLRDELSPTGLFAVLLLSSGLVFLSLLERTFAQRAALNMIPAVLMLSAAYILQKDALVVYGVIVLLVLNRIGAFFSSLPIIYWEYRKGGIPLNNKSAGIKVVFAAAVVGELLSIKALYLSLRAFERGPIAEVTALASSQPVFVLIGAVFLAYFLRIRFWIIPEIKTIENFLIALIAVALIMSSIYLISGA